MKKLVGREAIGQVSGASALCFSDQVRTFANYDLPNNVIIDDCTLREGRQIEGVVLTVDECVRIARLLEELGVPMIQIANFRPYDYDVMKAIGKLGLKMETETMSAAHQYPPYTFDGVKVAIDRALDCNLGFVLCSFLSDDIVQAYADGARGAMKGNLSALKERQIDITVQAAKYAKGQGRPINVNLGDFLRCEFTFMERFIHAIVDNGVNIIHLDDISAPAPPPVYQYVVSWIHKRVPKARLGIHVHNDFGNALNAVLAAVQGGVEVAICGVNGLGEKAGHCDLAQLVLNLELFYGFDTGIRREKLVEVSTAIADIMNQPVPPAWPIVGSRAFSAVSDAHWAWSETGHPFLAHCVLPEVVGGIARPVFGEWGGRWGLGKKVRELGMPEIPDEKVGAVVDALRSEMRWKKKPLTDEEFRRVVMSAVEAK